METRDIPKLLGLFYFVFLTVPLYIQWDQFIIVRVILPTPSYQVLSNCMLDFKRLRLNFLNILNLLTLKVVLGDHPTSLKNIDYIQIKIVKFNPHRYSNIVVPTVYAFSKQNLSLFVIVLVVS